VEFPAHVQHNKQVYQGGCKEELMSCPVEVPQLYSTVKDLIKLRGLRMRYIVICLLQCNTKNSHLHFHIIRYVRMSGLAYILCEAH